MFTQRFPLFPLLGFLLCTVACSGPGTSIRLANDPLQAVHADMLRQLAATSSFRLGLPRSITVTPQGDAVLFLRSNGPRSFVQDLWLFDVSSASERMLLSAEQALGGDDEKLTLEELARRERARSASRGIASFSMADDGNTLLVPLSGRLFVVDITDRAKPGVRELKTASKGFPIDARLGPDSKTVACVREGDLYVIDSSNGTETRLTSGASTTVTHATAEFVAQEEMDRNAGYWFSPDTTRILYQRTDTSMIEQFTIADSADPAKPAQTWPYPRAGKANADVTLGIISVGGGETTWVSWDRVTYPYLARVNWSSKAPLTILVQNRAQTEQVLLAVDPATGSTSTLLRETDPAWINLYHAPRWLPDGSGFLWTTEQNATAPNDRPRIELRNADGSLSATLTDGSEHSTLIGLDRGVPPAAIITKSSDHRGNRLWRIPLRTREAPLPLSDGESHVMHDAILSTQSGTWVHATTAADGTARWSVKRSLREGEPVGTLRSTVEAMSLLPTPQYVTVTVNTVELNAVIVRPSSFEPGRKYPVLNSIYGGPRVSTVAASAKAFAQRQWMAEQGFIVVSIDARGTPGKGRDWERTIKNNLIDIPLADQAAATLALCAAHPEMDPQRIGIYGWSFGGYFSVLATQLRPDVFRSGVAIAPVADWRDYDTHYTERYMGHPETNTAGYDATSALTHAGKLSVPLLIMHGTADDNVFSVHSLRLTDALFRAGRHFEFVPLAGFTHAVNEPAALVRLWERAASHFRRTLGEPTK